MQINRCATDAAGHGGGEKKMIGSTRRRFATACGAIFCVADAIGALAR
jgi:hypothetical protein